MLTTDVDAVTRICVACFPVPWSREEFLRELSRDYSVLRVLRPSSGEAVCAFANYWHVADELQVMNVATEPTAQRRGYGRALLQDMIQTGQNRRVSFISLEVRRSNVAARALYRSFNFVELGLRQRYYSDNGEDAVVMQLSL